MQASNLHILKLQSNTTVWTVTQILLRVWLHFIKDDKHKTASVVVSVRPTRHRNVNSCTSQIRALFITVRTDYVSTLTLMS